VRLTPEAERLLDEARPLLASLREVLHARASRPRDRVKIGATDSLLASWFPALLRGAIDQLPGIDIELHAHRGPNLLERLHSGDYAVGFYPASAGEPELRPTVKCPRLLAGAPGLKLCPGARRFRRE
jgi:DNA-binding transcriptional LysR family regulator